MIKVKRSVLLEALKAIQPGLAKKELLEQSMSFVFTDGRVFTYNDEVAVSFPIDIDIEGAVPAKEFFALVNKVKAEEFELTIKDNELLLKGSKAKAGLRLEKEITLPIDAIGEPSKWYELPETFAEAVKFCLFSASRNENHQALTCIHIFDGFAESCDNHRITRYDMGEGSEKAFPSELLIKATITKDICSHNPVEYGITDGWLHFRNENDVTFACRYFNNIDYPDFDRFLECKGETLKFPAELQSVMDRASVLSDGDRVTLIVEKGEILVTTQNQSGWFEESLPVEYKGEPVEFDIQPEFMNKILAFNGEVTIGQNALRFDNDDFIHVVQILAPKQK